MNLIQLLGAAELGLIYGLVALGVYLTFRIIDFPDLTVDGSFPMGAAIVAMAIVSGVNPWLATSLAFFGGVSAGMITGYLHVRWKIQGLLAGILTMTGLYSINLRIMGRPNIALLDEVTIFPQGDSIFWVLGAFVSIVTVALIFFLNSEIGLGIRATGGNEKVARAQGVRVNQMKLLTLGLSNGIVALGGALFAQSQGFADITLGPGTIIIGLASVIVGGVIFRTRKVKWLLISCVVGSVAYRLAVAFALNAGGIGLHASDMKLISAVIITFMMILPRIQAKIAAKRKKAS